MAHRQFVNWKRLETAPGDAVYAVIDGQVVRINSALGKREAPLNGISPEQVAYALWDELCMQQWCFQAGRIGTINLVAYARSSAEQDEHGGVRSQQWQDQPCRCSENPFYHWAGCIGRKLSGARATVCCDWDPLTASHVRDVGLWH
jgi:hypothetical protein